MRARTKMKGLGWLLSTVMAVLLLFSVSHIDSNAAEVVLSLDSDATYSNTDLVGYTRIELNGHTLTVTDDFSTSAKVILGTNGKLNVNGNMTATGDINCQEGNIEVIGDYTQNAKTLTFGLSRMSVGGDIIFANNGKYYDAQGYNSGAVGSSIVSVSGSFYQNSVSEVGTNSSQKNVTWRIAKDIIQGEGSGFLHMENVILNGITKQYVKLNSNSDMISFTPTNKSIKFEGYLNGAKLLDDFSPEMDGDLYVGEALDLNGKKLTLPHGLISTSSIAIGGDGVLTVNGNFTSSGYVNCENGNITVNGNYTQSASCIFLNYSKVNISGDVSFIGNGYYETYRYYYQSHGKSTVNVGGNYLHSSVEGTKGSYPDVTWVISGNITQTEDTGYLDLKKLTLCGKAEQVIQLQSNSWIDSLKPDSNNVKLAGYLNVGALLADFSPKMDSSLKTSGIEINGFTLTLPKGMDATGPVRPGKGGKLIVYGDLVTTERLGIKDGSLEINGNLIQKGDYIYLENSNVKITGNALFTDRGTIAGVDNNSSAIVEGNLVYESSTDVSENGAIWGVGGDVEQKSGAGKLYFRYLYLRTPGSSVTFTNGNADTIEIEAQKSKYSFNPDNCYTTLSAISVVTFDANGGTSEIANKNVRSTAAYGDLPTPTKASHIFDGWFTEKENGEQITAETIVTAVEDSTLYAHWTPYYTVTFDANGGSVDPSSVIVVAGQSIADLPTPELSGLLFDGWFTARDGGVRILSEEDLKVTEDVTLYAHWKTVATVTMYRLYNPNSGEHFYTSSERERKALAKQGWNDEGFAWEGPSYSNTPVYRLYNENAGDHHYTPSKKERDNLIKQGWKDEGIGWYSDDAKTKPLYRLYNPNAVTGSHHYTTSKKERDNLVKQGWKDEGIGWYGF